MIKEQNDINTNANHEDFVLHVDMFNRWSDNLPSFGTDLHLTGLV